MKTRGVTSWTATLELSLIGAQLLAGVILAGIVSGTSAKPLRAPQNVVQRAWANNTVVVNSVDSYCLVVPKDPHTNIGDSEYTGGTTVYCTPSIVTSTDQGTMPAGFWKNVSFQEGEGEGKYVQLTGCIDPSVLDRLNTEDEGGQYDSSGGANGIGNPENSVCAGYNHYIQLIEPSGPRACIRCCADEGDCPTHQDKDGCPSVIPGDYFDCD